MICNYGKAIQNDSPYFKRSLPCKFNAVLGVVLLQKDRVAFDACDGHPIEGIASAKNVAVDDDRNIAVALV